MHLTARHNKLSARSDGFIVILKNIQYFEKQGTFFKSKN